MVPTHSLFAFPLPLLPPQLQALPSASAEPEPCPEAWISTNAQVPTLLFRDSLAPPELSWHFGGSKEEARGEGITGWYFLAVFQFMLECQS